MKKNNRGVSLIEILIAVVVFTICITPIVSQLMVGMRISKKADDQQAATDYAKSIAETVKQMELSDEYSDAQLFQMADDFQMDSLTYSNSYYSVKADGSAGTVIPEGSKLISAGGSYSSVTAMYQAVNTANKASGVSPEAVVRQYQFTGTAEVDDREYEVQIDMDTLPYALSALNSTSNYDLNAVNLGNLSSLDASTTAIITDASNYDAPVSVSFFNAVISSLENSGIEEDAMLAVQLKNGTRSLNDSATKTIHIEVNEVTSDPNGYKYQVVCKLIYDNSYISTYFDVPTDASHIEYEVHNQLYKELPDVYLMYNQFLYNKNYGDDDIQIVNNLDSETAKVYVVRTVETSSNVQDVVSPESGSSLLPDQLIPDETTQYRDAKSGANYMYITKFTVTDNVEVYTNIPLTQPSPTGTEVSNITNGAVSRLTKISTNTTESVVKPLEEDERYSEQGRIYNIVITLTNTETGIVTTFDTSKGDY